MSALDQLVTIPEDEMDVFEAVDDVIDRSITSGSPLAAMEFGTHLAGSAILRGLALAKLLYRLKETWPLFRAAGIDDELENVVTERMGLSLETITKYIRLWEAIFANATIDTETKHMLMRRPIKDLLLLTAAAKDGSMNSDDLRQAALAPTSYDLRNRIRKARGEHTSSSSAVYLKVHKDQEGQFPHGAITAHRNGETVVAGILFLDVPEELGQMAVFRIINSARIEEV